MASHANAGRDGGGGANSVAVFVAPPSGSSEEIVGGSGRRSLAVRAVGARARAIWLQRTLVETRHLSVRYARGNALSIADLSTSVSGLMSDE